MMKYERVQYKKLSYTILKDSGIPDLMRIVNEVTNRMKKFSKSSKSPEKAIRAVKASLDDHNVIGEEDHQVDHDAASSLPRTPHKEKPTPPKDFSLKPRGLLENLAIRKERE